MKKFSFILSVLLMSACLCAQTNDISVMHTVRYSDIRSPYFKEVYKIASQNKFEMPFFINKKRDITYLRKNRIMIRPYSYENLSYPFLRECQPERYGTE